MQCIIIAHLGTYTILTLGAFLLYSYVQYPKRYLLGATLVIRYDHKDGLIDFQHAITNLAALHFSGWRDLLEISYFDSRQDASASIGFLGSIRVQSFLTDKVIELQTSDAWICERLKEIEESRFKTERLTLGNDEVLRLRDRLVVPNLPNLKYKIMD